jgi:chromosome segregation ATPase
MDIYAKQMETFQLRIDALAPEYNAAVTRARGEAMEMADKETRLQHCQAALAKAMEEVRLTAAEEARCKEAAVLQSGKEAFAATEAQRRAELFQEKDNVAKMAQELQQNAAKLANHKAKLAEQARNEQEKQNRVADEAKAKANSEKQSADRLRKAAEMASRDRVALEKELAEKDQILGKAQSWADVQASEFEKTKENLRDELAEAQEARERANSATEAKNQAGAAARQAADSEARTKTAHANKLAELKALQNEIAAAENSVADAESQVKMTEQQIETGKRKLASKLKYEGKDRDTLEALRKKLEDARAELQMRTKTLNETKSKCDDSVEDANRLESTATQKTLAVAKTEGRIKSQENHVEDYKSDADAGDPEAKERYDQEMEELKALRVKLEADQTAAQHATGEFKAAEEVATVHKQEYTKAAKAHALAEETVNGILEQIREYEAKMKHNLDARQAAEDALNALQNTLANAQADVEAKRKHLDDLRARLKALMASLAQLEADAQQAGLDRVRADADVESKTNLERKAAGWADRQELEAKNAQDRADREGQEAKEAAAAVQQATRVRQQAEDSLDAQRAVEDKANKAADDQRVAAAEANMNAAAQAELARMTEHKEEDAKRQASHAAEDSKNKTQRRDNAIADRDDHQRRMEEAKVTAESEVSKLAELNAAWRAAQQANFEAEQVDLKCALAVARELAEVKCQRLILKEFQAVVARLEAPWQKAKRDYETALAAREKAQAELTSLGAAPPAPTEVQSEAQ